MKKIIISILVLISFTLTAQNKSEKGTNPIIAVGGTGGINLSQFSYSNSAYDNYDKALLINPQFGLRVEYFLSKIFSIRPAFMYTVRGEKIDNTNINYLLSSKNFDISVPVTLTFLPDGKISPYIFLAPVYESTSGGIIGLEDITTDITSANHSKSSFGITPGVGFKFNLSKNAYITLEGGYHLGLSNTYSESELSGEANALNMSEYQIEGSRKNRATEVMLSLMFIISKKHVEVIIEDEIIPDKITDDVNENDEPEEEEIVIEEKVNYTIDEIEKYIHEGVDVTNRKISFDNIEFEFNKSDLKEGSELILNDIVKFMKKNPKVKIQINGHTDNVGSSEVNMKLSKGRAQAVYDYLLSSGIKNNRLTHKGFGDTQPLETNETESGRAKNRRVEFQIVSQ